jgi:YD repeat-containing protein
MLQSVKDPKGRITTFEYDALGRRTAKINVAKKEINRYIYDGNVLLHEFSYPLEERPKLIADELGRLSFDKKENTENLTTWVFEEGSFVPQAKIVDGKTYSIISDYLGTLQGTPFLRQLFSS